MALSLDGKTLAVVVLSDYTTIRLWDMARQQEIGVLRGHTYGGGHFPGVQSVAFSSDGQVLASGGGDTTVRLWDVARQQEIVVLQGHTGVVWSVAFSPDGQILASGSDDGSVLLWGVLPPLRTPTAVEPLSSDGQGSTLPQQTALLPAYPNPGNPDVWIPYELAKDAEVTIRIYNVVGQPVRTLELGRQAAGRHLSRESAAYWDGRATDGREVASGVYYCTLHAGTVAMTRTLVMIK
jgi:hypothetical protein